jgi:hypothetical protein
MRGAGDDADAGRVRGSVVVLWRAGLGVSEFYLTGWQLGVLRSRGVS